MPEGRSRSPYWVDGAIAALLALIGVAQLMGGVEESLRDHLREPDGLAYALILGQAMPLVWRRRWPATIFLTVSLVWMIERVLDYPTTMTVFALAFALHAVGSDLPPRRSAIIGWSGVAILVAFTILGVIVQDSVFLLDAIVMGSFLALAYLLGREVHTRRREAYELEMRARQLEADREAQAREAVRRERSRIARELHDVVAHQMTVMTVQAAAARRTIERDPDQAKESLGAIEAAGHDALTEMRRLLGLLRSPDQPAQRTPQPGLARLDGLVDQMAEAGLTVRLILEGDLKPLPAGVDLNAYRIVQESLTNTLKHGGPNASAEVRLEFGPEDLAIEVSDDGRGAAQRLAATNGGHGLIGMQERIALLNGQFNAGPKDGGGYRVRARIPVPA